MRIERSELETWMDDCSSQPSDHLYSPGSIITSQDNSIPPIGVRTPGAWAHLSARLPVLGDTDVVSLSGVITRPKTRRAYTGAAPPQRNENITLPLPHRFPDGVCTTSSDPISTCRKACGAPSSAKASNRATPDSSFCPIATCSTRILSIERLSAPCRLKRRPSDPKRFYTGSPSFPNETAPSPRRCSRLHAADGNCSQFGQPGCVQRGDVSTAQRQAGVHRNLEHHQHPSGYCPLDIHRRHHLHLSRLQSCVVPSPLPARHRADHPLCG